MQEDSDTESEYESVPSPVPIIGKKRKVTKSESPKDNVATTSSTDAKPLPSEGLSKLVYFYLLILGKLWGEQKYM